MPSHLSHHQKSVYPSYNEETKTSNKSSWSPAAGRDEGGHLPDWKDKNKNNLTSNTGNQEPNDSNNNDSTWSPSVGRNESGYLPNNIPKYPEDNDLESNIPIADTSWTDNTVTMNDWQSRNDNVNTFFTGGGTKLNSSNWETQKLFNAGQDILKELGLTDTKKNMQIAMNILQGGDRIWGKTSRALQGTNSTQYNNIMDIVGKDAEGNRKSWDTWGTNLRGDASYGGVPISQEDYNDKLTNRAGKWEPGSNMAKYQRMLTDAWHTANPNWKESGSNKLGGMLIGAMLPLSPAVAAVTFGATGIETLKGNLTKPQNAMDLLLNPLGSLIPDSWINNPKEGIKKLKINGKQITINDKMVDRGDEDGGIFSKYDLMEPNVGNDSGVNQSSPYYNSSDNIEDIPDDESEEEEENTLVADDNPAWWNFRLFETIFSPLSALNYQEGDIVQNKPEDIAVNTVRKLLEQAEVDEQAKHILKTLIEENEVIANVVDKYDDIKARVNELIGPIEISADAEDLSIQDETPSGFMAREDLDKEEIGLQKQLGDLNLTENDNPEQQSGFLGL
jgi:hypothetical protein|tara:strand:+ start:57 stop:1736 length:1680 start_codon:yes stop_codon:yes gene_type:complete